MIFEKIHLKDIYPFLDCDGADPILEIMVQDTVISERPRPSMLVLPGGGYGNPWDGEAQNVGFEFMTLGLNAFVLKYSATPVTYPHQLIEVACAVDYIITNSQKFNCDPTKTAILGFSAGGHLASSYCTMRDREEVTSVVSEPKPVQAALLCYPVISVEAPTNMGTFYNLLGKKDITKEDELRFSTDKFVSKDLTPPTFIWTTAEDTVVDPINTLKYASALSNHRIPFELHIFPQGNHGLSTAKYGIVNDSKHPVCEYMNVWTDYAKKWLKLIFNI